MRRFLSLILILLVCGCLRGQDSLFTAAEKPSASTNDEAVTVGMVFNAKLDGVATFTRIYKSTAADTSTYVIAYWLQTGQLLYSQPWKASGPVGWKRIAMTFPLPITAGVNYIVGVFLPAGDYGARTNTFTADRTRGNLVAPATNKVGGNGRFKYGSSLAFPPSTYQSSAYYVDLVFQPIQTQTLIVNAGRDTTYALPRDTVFLKGIVTGNAPTFTWDFVDSLSVTWDTSGVFRMWKTNTLQPYLTGMTEGRYVFRLTGKDAIGNVSANDVTIDIVADPTGVMIELLRNGTWRIKDDKKLFLMKANQ